MEIIEDKIFLYRGIDFEMAINHPKDGTAGFLLFFTINYDREFLSFTRNLKIDYLITNQYIDSDQYNIDDPDILNNSYVCIYQTGPSFQPVYDAIKRRIMTNNLSSTMYIQNHMNPTGYIDL